MCWYCTVASKKYHLQVNIELDIEIDLPRSGADRGCDSASKPFSEKILTTGQNPNHFLTGSKKLRGGQGNVFASAFVRDSVRVAPGGAENTRWNTHK